ncbi:MAG: ATP-grasp domain-containing protein [Candidatus Sulfotelmatobacter sp.]
MAKNLGYRVVVTDMYSERPGYKWADEHAVVDITDIDATLAAARRFNVDGIVCDTTDVGVPTMAYVAEKLGLPGIGYETALNFTNKHRMRVITSQAGVPNPTFHLVHGYAKAKSAALELQYPVVVKPPDNQSSRGVHVVNTPDQMEPAYLDAMQYSRAGGVIVESFLDGVEVTVESFCVNRNVFAVGISDKDHFNHRPEVANRLTYPADFPEKVMSRIREVNEKAVIALGMCTGITHAEYMVVGNEVYLVEIAARGAGSRVYSHIVPHLACAPIPSLYLRYLMGEGINFSTDETSDRAANLAFFCFEPGYVTAIEGVECATKIPGVQEILLEFQVGDRLALPVDDRSRHGLVLVLGTNRAEVLTAAEEALRTVKVTVQ